MLIEYILISKLILRRSLFFQTDIVLVIVITLSILYTSYQNKTNGHFFFLLANLRFDFLFFSSLDQSYLSVVKIVYDRLFWMIVQTTARLLIVWTVLFALGASKIPCISQHEATVDKKYGTFWSKLQSILNSHFSWCFSVTSISPLVFSCNQL